MTDSGTFGGGLNFGIRGGATAPPTDPTPTDDAPAASAPDSQSAVSAPQEPSLFGSGLRGILPGPNYTAPDPKATALDQTADTLQQRIQRANSVATNPLLQLFNPEGVQAARNFVPQATEALQKIKQQKADMQANAVQAQTLGLAPGEVPDEATLADRVAVAQSKALKGDLRVFRGLQAVDPKLAEAIQDTVHEAVAGHLNNAQLAFDSLAGMQNQGQYRAKLDQLRKDGTLTDLEALGLKVPPDFNSFNATKANEARSLREARIGVDTIRQKLEERNTYQPMEEKEAKTYSGRLTTAYGDQITNGTWSRNAAAGTRGLVVNGASDPRDLGKNFTLATPEQRTAIEAESDKLTPKEEREKYRAFNRTYQMATTDGAGKPMAPGTINTNPNVQQGIAEALASTLRGGTGGANTSLLKMETAKRGAVQGLLDSIVGGYAGGLNTLAGKDVRPYLTKLTQSQIRDVLDFLKVYNQDNVAGRVEKVAERAGALGLDAAAIGYGDKESAGAVADAIERGRQAQIARMMPFHQAIGGGDGVFQLGAQRPGASATGGPAGSMPTTQIPGAAPLTTPVQQATNSTPPVTGPGGPGTPPTGNPVAPLAGTGAPGGPPAGGAPVTIAGQQISVPLPAGASPNYTAAVQRIESGNEKSPWTAGTAKSSASGAFQFINSTWAADKPPGAPARAGDATPEQQAAAFATHTAKNAQALAAAKLPVNDTNLYIAHNLGAGGAQTLLTADPNADARSIIGETAAANNPKFFRGRPTVATVLGRYAAAMSPDVEPTKPQPGAGGATAEPPGLMSRIASVLTGARLGETDAETYARESARTNAAIRNTAAQNAPAAGSTFGAIGGSLAGPGGTIAGGAAGGGAGQALKDYLLGNPQSPTEIAKQTALGGVLGVASEARPLLAAAGRVVGSGAVEGGTKAAEGGDAGEVADATVQGAGAAAGGELFGRALGMAGHKLFSMFGPDAKQVVADAAKTYHEATETLKTETPRLPSVGGASAAVNPKYAAAEAAKDKAEQTLKDAGLEPDAAAYAHKVTSEGVPKQEAQVSRPGALEKQRLGEGYQGLREEVNEGDIWGNLKKPQANQTVPQSNFPINESPREKIMRTGYDNLVRVDASKLQQAAASRSQGGLTVNPAKLDAVRQSGSGDGYPRVDVTGGKVSIEDGVHRTTVAGERGQTIDVAVKTPEEADWLRKNAAPGTGLSDGPMAAIEAKKVSSTHTELAQRTEMAITAPAKDWAEKWTQLKDARSALLDAERDALTSTAAGRTQTAKDMRTLADTVRTQQEKVANYVFGMKDGPAFMSRLKTLDVRYRNLMEATNQGDLASAATKTGAEGRAIDQKFRAFAHDDPTAIAAWNAMRGAAGKSGNVEKDVRTLVGAENIPYLGKAVKAAKMIGAFKQWMRERTAGSPVKFSDLVNLPEAPRPAIPGNAIQRAAVQGSTQQ